MHNTERKSWLSALIERLPAAFRLGRMPYVFLFAVMVIAILLLYSAISPYENARGMFLSLSALLAVLLLAVNQGMPLAWGVNLASAAGLLA